MKNKLNLKLCSTCQQLFINLKTKDCESCTEKKKAYFKKVALENTNRMLAKLKKWNKIKDTFYR